MPKTLVILIITIFLISLSGKAQVNTFDAKKYSVEALQEDFNYMRSQIQSKGTVIYLYNTKKETDHYLDSLYACIKEPMTDIEFFRFIAPVQVFFKDVHTGVFPSATIRKTFFESQYLFPLSIELITNKVYVEKNNSGNEQLNSNPEILSINDIPMDQIIERCSQILPREGYDTGYPLNWLNKDFLYYYYFIYGPCESYIVELKTKNGVSQVETIQGISLKTFWSKIDETNPIQNELNIYSQVDDSLKTITLTLNDFSDKTIKSNHKASVRKIIQAEFDTILKTGYSNLIIDIRNNDGGNSGNGKKVLKYLLDTPFEIKQSVRVVKNKEEEDLLKRTRTAMYGEFQRGSYKPHKDGFKGDVYLLVNEGSTSAAVVFAATLKRHNRAIFIGKEMGGNPIVMGGGLWDNVKKTPNTQISFMFGNKCSILNDLELNTGHGLIPEHVVEKTYEDFVAGKDSQMLYTLELIKNK